MIDNAEHKHISVSGSNLTSEHLEERTVRRIPVPKEYADRIMEAVGEIDRLRNSQYKLWRLMEEAIPEVTNDKHWKLSVEDATKLYVEEA
jgi:hypothetical protein